MVAMKEKFTRSFDPLEEMKERHPLARYRTAMRMQRINKRSRRQVISVNDLPNGTVEVPLFTTEG